jgi:hypothetical protein
VLQQLDFFFYEYGIYFFWTSNKNKIDLALSFSAMCPLIQKALKSSSSSFNFCFFGIFFETSSITSEFVLILVQHNL